MKHAPAIAIAVGAVALGVGIALAYRNRQPKVSPSNLLASSTEGVQPISAPPELIPVPAGWKYAKSTADIPSEAVARAPKFLKTGKLGDFEDHTTWGLLYEYHFDDHVSPGTKKWHKGVSTLLPATVAA